MGRSSVCRPHLVHTPQGPPQKCTWARPCTSLSGHTLATRLPPQVPRAPVPRALGRPGGMWGVRGRWSAAASPPSAAPRSCIIDKDELKDGLRVLIPMDDKLLYAGHVQTVHSPDM